MPTRADLRLLTMLRPGAYEHLGVLKEYTGYVAYMRRHNLFKQFALVEHVVDQLAFAAYTQLIQYRSLGVIVPTGLADVGDLRCERFIAWKEAHCLALHALRFQAVDDLPRYGFVFTPTAAAQVHAELVHFYEHFCILEADHAAQASEHTGYQVQPLWRQIVEQFVCAIHDIYQEDVRRQEEMDEEIFDIYTQWPTQREAIVEPAPTQSASLATPVSPMPPIAVEAVTSLSPSASAGLSNKAATPASTPRFTFGPVIHFRPASIPRLPPVQQHLLHSQTAQAGPSRLQLLRTDSKSD